MATLSTVKNPKIIASTIKINIRPFQHRMKWSPRGISRGLQAFVNVMFVWNVKRTSSELQALEVHLTFQSHFILCGKDTFTVIPVGSYFNANPKKQGNHLLHESVFHMNPCSTCISIWRWLTLKLSTFYQNTHFFSLTPVFYKESTWYDTDGPCGRQDQRQNCHFLTPKYHFSR